MAMTIHNITHASPSLEPMTTSNVSPQTQTGPAVFSAIPNSSDNMEEVSMKFSESVEKNTKKLEQRAIKPRTEQRVEKLTQLYQLLTNHDTQTLHDEVRRLLTQSQQSLSLAHLLTIAENDPAKADVILQKARMHAQQSSQSETFNKLQALANELYEHHGAEVMAGLNTASALAMFSQDSEHRQAMRHLYYQHVVGQGSLVALFDALLTQFDDTHFAQGLHTLMRALTDDLAAQFPSLPRDQLRVLLKDLTASQQLSHILNSVQALLKRFAAKGMIRTMTSAKLTRKLIEFTQSNLYPREVKNLNADAVGEDPLAQVAFLNGLYPLVQKMPLPIWKDPKSRQNTLNLLLRLMTEYSHYERQHRPLDIRSDLHS